jgi:2,3-bisphosphoglycerate-dependent phosphoglycerate mutase
VTASSLEVHLTHDPLSVTRVTLVRHGRTAWNAAMRIQGHTDIPLDDVGMWQALRLIDALAEGQDPITAIYASDLARAMHTVMPLATRLGLDVQPDAALRERHFGCMEGMTLDEIALHLPDDARRWRGRDLDHAPRGGESLRAFHERSVAAFTRIASRHPGEHILIASHGGTLDCMHRHGHGLPIEAPRAWHTGNAGIHRMLHSTAGWRVVGWNDEHHLDGVSSP